MLTPDQWDPSDGLGELQSDFPDVLLFVTTSNAKKLRNIAFHKLLGVLPLAFFSFCAQTMPAAPAQLSISQHVVIWCTAYCLPSLRCTLRHVHRMSMIKRVMIRIYSLEAVVWTPHLVFEYVCAGVET